MPQEERRRPSCMLVGCAIFCVVCFTVCGLLGFFDTFIESALARPFDARLWQTASLRERGRMAKDLRSSGKLIGLNRDEVLALLGSPDHDDGRDTIAYKVDLGYKFAFDPWLYYLTIDFDKTSGRVEQVVLLD